MKIRLDIYLTDSGLASSRTRAKELIESGIVLVNDLPAKKSGQQVEDTDKIELSGRQNPYVSRGGLKLEKAVSVFNLDLDKKTAMDIGASTGGFTHCMLLNGAERVYAVDVGTDQLHESLREDERVINLEKTNIRTLSCDIVPPVDFISIDVSFISLLQVLPTAKNFLKEDGKIVALIKPQFEAGKANLNKKGVVKDKKVHLKVINEILEFSEQIGLFPQKLDFSPVKGPEGNIEYLVLLAKQKTDNDIDASKVVNESHISL